MLRLASTTFCVVLNLISSRNLHKMSASFTFADTPVAPPPPPASDECGIKTSDSPAIKNAPLPADGPGSRHFNNYLLFFLLFSVPYYFTRKVGGGYKTFFFFLIVLGIPVLASFWSIVSAFSPRINEKVKLPNKGVEHYLEFHTPELAKKYSGRNKIPMETFHELYFDNKVSFKGDALDVLEYRHDWANFRFTLSLYKFFLTGMIPEVIMHTRSQGTSVCLAIN